MCRTLTFLLLFGTPVLAAESSGVVYDKWPFGARRAERRQKETAAALGIPIHKTVTVGVDPSGEAVLMDFMLIPAGAFEMGSGAMVSDVNPRIGWAAVAAGGLPALVLLGLLLARAIRRRRVQFSLRWLVSLIVCGSLIVMGIMRIRQHRLAQLQRFSDEQLHRVVIAHPFYLGRSEVTKLQWQTLMPGGGIASGPDRPVDSVNWHECRDYLEKLTARLGAACALPSESEWEYACRAGTTGGYHFGDDEAQLVDHAWFYANSNRRTHAVGGKPPNAWGLHDMHGNVWEWCQDWYGGEYYAVSPGRDPGGPEAGTRRVVRGGSWLAQGWMTRSHHRLGYRPGQSFRTLGFRVRLSVGADRLSQQASGGRGEEP